MARASVIIPVLGDPQQMEDTLVSVLENRPADCQVIVVFNQPYDDPYELAGEVDFVEARAGAGWAECVNRAVACSSGEVVFVVHSAVEVEPGWLEAARDALKDPLVAAVVPTVLCRYEERRIVSSGTILKRSGRIARRDEGKLLESGGAAGRYSPPDDVLPEPLAGAYRRSALVAAGGFCPRLGEETAVVDLGLRLVEAGLRCVHAPSCRVLARPAAWDRRPARRGRQHELLFWRWLGAAGRPVSLARHLALWFGVVAASPTGTRRFLEMCGRAVGAVEWLLRRRGLRLPEPVGRTSEVPLPAPAAELEGRASHAALRGPHFHKPRRSVADDAPVRRAG